MKQKLLVGIFFILILSLLANCKHRSSPFISPTFPNGTSTYIEVEPFDTDKKYTSSQLIDTAEYVWLETTQASRFINIDRLEVMGPYFYILDKETNAIYIFETSGKFKKRISGANNNFGLKKIGDFSIDYSTKKILINDPGLNTMFFCDKEGNFISTRKNDFTFYSFSVDKLNDSICYHYRAFLPHQNPKLFQNTLIVTNGKLDTTEGYLEYDADNISYKDVLHNRQSFYTNSKSILLSFPFQYNIFELVDGNISDRYILTLPRKYQIPENFLYDGSYNNRRIKMMLSDKRNKYIIWGCSDIYKLDNGIITFRLHSQEKRRNTFFYNLNNNHYVRVANISSDGVVSNLPIVEDRFLHSDSEFVYASISAKLMFEAKLMAGLSTLVTHKTIQDFFSKANNMSNPIIAKYKIKLF